MPVDRPTFSTVIKAVLALCLLVNALGWSIHVQAADLANTGDTVVQTDVGGFDGHAKSSGDDPAGSIDPCDHVELHFFGIVPAVAQATVPTNDKLDFAPGVRYASPHPQPLIIPPIV